MVIKTEFKQAVLNKTLLAFAQPTHVILTMRACDIFGHHFSFDAFSTVHTNAICTRFRFDHFQERFQINAFSMKTLMGISADGRPKRIEMFAFSNENALV